MSGTCYFLSDDKKSFSESESACRNKGGKMAEPKDQNTDKIVHEAAKSKWNSDHYWIGIKEVGSSWKFLSVGSTVAWTNWYTGNPVQPNESKDQARCVYMQTEYEERFDAHCSSNKYYICEL